ncbi:MAG: hypothetical protein AMS15_07290, partial [Planctomycetes bacterium DG_23]
MAAEGKPKTYQRPNVLPLSLAAFFNDTGSDMLFAFYPLFLVLILKVNMGQLGGLDSIALFAGLLLRPITGLIADRKGRRHFIWVGYSCLMLSRALQGLARIWWHLAPPKIIYEVGRGVRNPPREALMADSVPQEERGLAFGLLDSMDTLGAMLGPLLGLGAMLGPLLGLGIFYLLRYYTDLGTESTFRFIFFAAAIPTVMSIFIIITRTREVKEFGGSEVSSASQSPRGSRLAAVKAHKTLLIFTIISCLFAFWAVTENFMLVCGLRILDISRQEMGEIWLVVILYCFINVTFAPTALYAGRLSDRIGRKLPIFLSLVILAALTLGFAFVGPTYWHIGLLFALHGIYQGFLKPAQKAFVADLAPEELRATALGGYSMLVGAAAVPGPFIFGLLW